MPSFDMFSKRQKKLRGEAPDVYTYDKIPHALRVQVVHIWQDAFGNIDAYESQAGQVYKYIYDILCREYGVFYLNNKYELNHGMLSEYLSALSEFFVSVEDSEKTFDVLEISYACIELYTQDSSHRLYSQS